MKIIIKYGSIYENQKYYYSSNTKNNKTAPIHCNKKGSGHLKYDIIQYNMLINIFFPYVIISFPEFENKIFKTK